MEGIKKVAVNKGGVIADLYILCDKGDDPDLRYGTCVVTTLAAHIPYFDLQLPYIRPLIRNIK